jgi:hypothetical protein
MGVLNHTYDGSPLFRPRAFVKVLPPPPSRWSVVQQKNFDGRTRWMSHDNLPHVSHPEKFVSATPVLIFTVQTDNATHQLF